MNPLITEEPLRYVPTTTLRKILALRRKYRFVAGGTDAGKTSAIMQVLLDMGGVLRNKRIDIVSKSIPHVRAGAWAEANQIIAAQDYGPYVRVLHTPDLHLIMPTGTELHFTSFDTYGKAHGPRRDVLFINEANYIPWTIANQLMIRTKGPVYADWNPSAPFWAYDEIIEHPDFKGVVDFITVTYRDNESLSAEKVADLERRKSNVSWWRVYGLGLLGQVEGQIFSGWRWIDDIPFGARLIYRGLDFGFTNDPTAIIAIWEYEGGYILDEECYQTGMLNPQIADFMGALTQPPTPTIADSSEPKSIAEIRMYGEPYGLNILPVQKYAGSKNDMVNFVKGLPISATTRSLNLREEYEQYMWVQDPISGNFTNILPDGFDHAIDAGLYGLSPFMAAIRRRRKKPRRASDTFDFSKRYGN